MKQIILTLLFATCVSWAFCQQKATDFTVKDCSGMDHHLFGELDAGQVIVLCWVMPCGSCTGPALTTYNVVQSFQASHPGKVFMYLCDDYANSSCSTLKNWGNSLGLSQSTLFSNAKIKMLDYGSNGMPKIVVLGGGTNHSVFYNANNTVNASALQNAIIDALGPTATGDIPGVTGTTLFPNPAGSEITIHISMEEPSSLEIGLMDFSGKETALLFKGMVPGGEHQIPLNLQPYQKGTYILRMTTAKGKSFKKIIIE